MLLSAGRDEPANDLFRVYELVLKGIFISKAKNDDFPIDFAIFTKALPTDRPTDGRTYPLILKEK